MGVSSRLGMLHLSGDTTHLSFHSCGHYDSPVASGGDYSHRIAPEAIETKLISDSTDIAESILEEARDSGNDMLVIGRTGISRAKRLTIGSVSSKIVNSGDSGAVCII